MNKKINKAMSRKVRLGRLGLPLWTIGLAVLMVAAAAGQAVGPVLSGSVTGSVGMVVEQAVVLDTDAALGSNPGFAGQDDGVSTRNDEGTEFTVALELNVGQTVYTTVYLQNDSGNDAAALLELNVPKGIDVEVTEVSNSIADNTSVVSEGQLTRNTWLVVVKSTAGADNDDGLKIKIEPQDDIAPGFYTITGRLVQIEG